LGSYARLPAPILIDKPADEELSWLACVYGLRGGLRQPEIDLQAIAEVFRENRLDRFHDHLARLASSGDLIPRVRYAGVDSPWPTLSTRRMRLCPASLELYLGDVPHAGLVSLLVIGVRLRSVEAAVSLLQETRFHKGTIRIGSRCLLCCLRDVLPDDRWAEPVDFDRDVTQILSLGQDLRAATPAAGGSDEAKVMQLVYRECAPFRRGSGDIRWPAELNRPSSGFCAHGRGVTVVAGEARHVFWGMVLSAAELTGAAGKLRSIRLGAVKALQESKTFQIGSFAPRGERSRRSHRECPQEAGRLVS
jgi:hypothetical protein